MARSQWKSKYVVLFLGACVAGVVFARTIFSQVGAEGILMILGGEVILIGTGFFLLAKQHSRYI